MTRKIGVVTGTRAEYGYLRPLLFEIQERDELDLRLYVTGMHLLRELGESIQEIRSDGFQIFDTVEMTRKPMTKDFELAEAIGRGIMGFSNSFKENRPDILIVFGDRIEPLAAALSASTMNIPVAHIAGGDTGLGDIDHVMRHAITKLSHLHFTQTEMSKKRVEKLGEESWRVFNVGALTLDTITSTSLIPFKELSARLGIPPHSYFLVVYHPTSTEWQKAKEQIKIVFEGLSDVTDKTSQVVMIYPNDYPGGTEIASFMNDFEAKETNVEIFRNLSHVEYLSLMKHSIALVGNSSSGIIEGPSLGVPYVCVGTRQKGRERAPNVIDVDYSKEEISAALRKAAYDSDFKTIVDKKSTPYGDGNASKLIADAICKITIDKKLLQKQLTY